MPFIELVGFNGKPMFVNAEKIVAVSEAQGSTKDEPKTYLYMQGDSDPWVVRGELADVLERVR